MMSVITASGMQQPIRTAVAATDVAMITVMIVAVMTLYSPC